MDLFLLAPTKRPDSNFKSGREDLEKRGPKDEM
jgi:hypothetical protein